MTYGYDAENRLMTASKTGLAAPYQYDPLGRRTRKSGTGVTGTFYLSDGTDEIAEYDGTSGTLTTRYIPGPAIDEPIAMVDGATGTKTYFHTNHQGSVIAMSGSGAALTEGPYTYDPYGNCFLSATQSPCSSSGEPYRFTGRRFDPETGLLYYRARFYDSNKGRFLQTDSVGYSADLNLYTYVGNAPTDKTDASGAMPGDPFDTPRDAAIDAIMSTNPISIRDNVELGGMVYKGAGGKFFAQPGVRGIGDHIPYEYHGNKGDLYGDWHTHGDYSKFARDGSIVRGDVHTDIFHSNHFSTDDKNISIRGEAREKNGYKSWLGTPSHDVKQYDPSTGEETVVTPQQNESDKLSAPDLSSPDPISTHATARPTTSSCSRSGGGCGSGGGYDVWGQ